MDVKLPSDLYAAIIKHCLDCVPEEACGVLAGPMTSDFQPTGDIQAVFPAENIDHSHLTYTIAPDDMLSAMSAVQNTGMEVVGVWHSHTHTEGYPSPTDVAKAVDPNWIYMLVSLQDAEPVTRAFEIREGVITELDIQ